MAATMAPKRFGQLDLPDGLTYRQLDYWWRYGVFAPLGVTKADQHPTSGYRRDWSIVEPVLHVLAHTITTFRAWGAEPSIDTVALAVERFAQAEPCYPFIGWSDRP